MDDARIVELFWQRDEVSLAETEAKYGSYCLANYNPHPALFVNAALPLPHGRGRVLK